jgi:hypothetical protein
MRSHTWPGLRALRNGSAVDSAAGRAPNPELADLPRHNCHKVLRSAVMAERAGKAESLKVIGGLIAVGMGLIVVCLFGIGALTVFAIKGKLGSGLVSILTAGFGVVGSLVGAYFGLKIGTDEANKASTATQAAEAKSNVYASFVPDNKAIEASEAAHKAAAAVRDQLGSSK